MVLNLFLIVGLVGLDQLSKYFAVKYLFDGATYTIIPYILGLRYTENTGAAFSMFSNSTNMLSLVTGVALIAMFCLMIFGKSVDKTEKTILAIVIAGGLGNLIDRLRIGFVVDYFEVLFMDFAIFNFADICVCCGMGLAVIYTIYNEYFKNKGVK